MIDLPATPIGFAALPEPLRARIEAELEPGERLLWAAQPNPTRPEGPMHSNASFAVWTIAWFFLSLFCVAMTRSTSPWRDEGGRVVLFCIGAIAGVIAFLMAVSYLAEFVRQGPRRRWWRQSLYMLSDRRAVIWEPDRGSPAVSVRQYPAGSLRSDQIERLEHPDGTGSLLLCLNHARDQCFAAVADVRQVDVLVRRFLVGPKTPTAATDLDPDVYEEPF